MTAFYIIAGIIAAIILPLCVRLRLSVVYEEKLRSVKVGWLFFSFTLYPKKEKPEKDKKTKKKNSSEKKEENSKSTPKPNILTPYMEQEGISGILHLLGQTLDALGGLLCGLRKGFVIHRLEVYATVTSDDAAETAILYGKACAVIYPLVNGIITAVRTVKYSVDVTADYIAQKTRADLYATLSLRPIRVIGEVFVLAFRLLKRIGLPIFRASKKAAPVQDSNKPDVPKEAQ